LVLTKLSDITDLGVLTSISSHHALIIQVNTHHSVICILGLAETSAHASHCTHTTNAACTSCERLSHVELLGASTICHATESCALQLVKGSWIGALIPAVSIGIHRLLVEAHTSATSLEVSKNVLLG
jgi:hypothetical protein